jgi:hypothetical protein
MVCIYGNEFDMGFFKMPNSLILSYSNSKLILLSLIAKKEANLFFLEKGPELAQL